MIDSAKGTKRKIIFCALETYSLVGGMQNFNRRVVTNLAARSAERMEVPPQIILLRDGTSIPSMDGKALIYSFKNRVSYLVGTARAVLAGCDLLIIGHINLLFLAIIARILRPRVKILVFVHGDEVWNDPQQRKRRWYEPYLLSAVDCIASVSQYTANVMAREFRVQISKFQLLPNSVDPITVPPASRHSVDPTILTVSRLGRRDRPKNIHQMIYAVAELRSVFPKFKYEIVGDGPLRNELESLAARLHVNDNVRFLGRVDDSELSEAYLRASVFALPSSKEGFGIVYLEAWQRSLPVICSSAGASSEIVSDGVDGFVVNPENVSEIAEGLHRLLSQPELAMNMGKSGQKKVEMKYMNGTFRKNLDRIIDNLLASPPPSQPEQSKT